MSTNNDKDIQALLTAKIARTGKYPFLFVGSGLTRRYYGTANWEGLLRKVCEEMSGDTFKYDFYSSIVDETSTFGKNPSIASLLEKDFNQFVLSDETYHEFRQKYSAEIKAGVSPFKIRVAEMFSDLSMLKTHDEIGKLQLAKNRVSGIITTNYDQLMEEVFEGFSVYIGQGELIFSNIYESGEIYKIHGCATKPESIVITQEDYEDFNSHQAYLVAKILTIFLEYPIIFLGYSLQDPNIRGILKSIAECLGQKRLDELKDRFIFVEHGNEEVVSGFTISFENGTAVEMTRVNTNNFGVVYDAVANIEATYSPKIIRQLRKSIYSLVRSSDPVGEIHVTGFEGLDELPPDKPLVLGIGVERNYRGLPIKPKDLYLDAVLDNLRLDPKLVIEQYLPDLLKSNPSGLPMFKYIQSYDRGLFGKVAEFYNRLDSVDAFLNNGIRKSKKSFRQIHSALNIEKILATESTSPDGFCAKLCYLEADEYDLDILKKYLTRLLNDNNDILDNNSELKRIIRIYDYLKHRNAPDTSPNSVTT